MKANILGVKALSCLNAGMPLGGRLILYVNRGGFESCYRLLFAPWCNGSTTGPGPVSGSSNLPGAVFCGIDVMVALLVADEYVGVRISYSALDTSRVG